MKEKKIIQYLLSKEFRRMISYALAIFFAIILVTNIGLRIFTRHNRTQSVPNFKGLTINQARDLADDKNLRIQLMDSVYNIYHKRGTVMDQEPKEGTQVKKNRNIFLVMNAMNPEKVMMPNVVGVSLRQAVAILESNGLLAGRLRYVPDIATNNVLNQRYKNREVSPGTEIEKGSHIDLILGRASYSESAQMPDLRGLTLREAEKQISLAYLNLGATIYDKSVQNSDDSLSAIIFKQKPDPDSRQFVNMGSIVDLWLTIDSEKIKDVSTEKNE